MAIGSGERPGTMWSDCELFEVLEWLAAHERKGHFTPASIEGERRKMEWRAW